jgi:two-component system chemotaxis response regulator CheY
MLTSVAPNMKVLVVDDISTMRRIVTRALHELGFAHAEEAENGQEALAKLKADHFGLVVCDWNMPEMGGLDFVRAIRADAESKSLPVLMVASPAQKDRLGEVLEAGASSCLVKPFTPEALQEKISDLLQTGVGG